MLSHQFETDDFYSKEAHNLLHKYLKGIKKIENLWWHILNQTINDPDFYKILTFETKFISNQDEIQHNFTLNSIQSSSLGLQSTPTASLERGKHPQMIVLDMINNNLIVKFH